MKQFRIIAIIYVVLTILSFKSVSALSCNYSDGELLKKEAQRIKVTYEMADYSRVSKVDIDGNKTNVLIPYYVFNLLVYNLKTENIFLQISNSSGSYDEYITNDMTEDGNYVITDDRTAQIDTYTIKVMSNLGSCSGDTIKTFTIVKPIYNVFSEYDYCKSSSAYYCKKFVEREMPFNNDEQFYKYINVSVDKDKTDKKEEKTITLWDSVKKNKTYVFYSVIITAIVSALVILFIRLKMRGDRL